MLESLCEHILHWLYSYLSENLGQFVRCFCVVGGILSSVRSFVPLGLSEQGFNEATISLGFVPLGFIPRFGGTLSLVRSEDINQLLLVGLEVFCDCCKQQT